MADDTKAVVVATPAPSQLEQLQNVAQQLRDLTDMMDVDAANSHELDEMECVAYEMHSQTARIFDRIVTAQYTRPSVWRRYLRDERPLYNAEEMIPLLRTLCPVSVPESCPWRGYAFSLVGDTRDYIMRIFVEDKGEIRDVVLAATAMDAAHERRFDSVFDNRSSIENVAGELGMSVATYLLTQTTEERSHVVALHLP